MDRKRLTKEEFIEKSNIKHNYKYSYDKVNYINNKKKVIITCNIHGDFEQVPKSHYLNGSGCIECSGLKRSNVDSFIKKSNIIHNNKYSYNKSVYINTNTKLIITCIIHGDFEQIPKSHLNGNGCISCSGLKKLTSSEFINRSKKIHGDKFLYDDVDYIGMYKKVNITCRKHGIFKQIASVHLNGNGCRKCKIASMFSTKDIFIQNSERVHDKLYDYSIVEYVSNDTEINIICKKHGIFKQTPHGHLNGRGCDQCNSSRGENKIENILKLNNIKYISQFRFKNSFNHIRRLRFDFAILNDDDSINSLIEYNGLQHYEFIKFFHKNEINFNLSKNRDKFKVDFCKENNIPLHIIKYDDNIDEKINEIVINEI